MSSPHAHRGGPPLLAPAVAWVGLTVAAAVLHPGTRPAAGVGHLVLLSSFTGDDGRDVIGQWTAASEALVTASGATWTLLRPGRFFSNALAWARVLPDAAAVPVGFARRAAAGIDPADVAAVAVRALTGDLVGAAPRLTGPESLTPLDELRILGDVLGRPLTVRELDPDDVVRGMLAAGTAPEVVDAIVARTLHEDEGAEPMVTVRELLGREPRRFVDRAWAHASAFGGSAPSVTGGGGP